MEDGKDLTDHPVHHCTVVGMTVKESTSQRVVKNTSMGICFKLYIASIYQIVFTYLLATSNIIVCTRHGNLNMYKLVNNVKY